MTHAGVPAGSPGAAGWAMALTNLPPTSKHTAGDRTADRVENEWHRNTVELDSSIDKTELEWMIDHSYELVDARYTASGPSPFPRCSIGGSASINRPVRRPGARSERPCADVGDRTFDLVR
jgi:hypothetical protein